MNFTYPLELESLSSQSSLLGQREPSTSLQQAPQFPHEGDEPAEQDGGKGLKRLALNLLGWLLGWTCPKVLMKKQVVKANLSPKQRFA